MKCQFVLLLLLQVAVLHIDCQSPKEDKDDQMRFYKCLACGRDHKFTEGRMKYLSCRKMLPRKIWQIERECRKEAIPGMELISEVWINICEDPKIGEKIYDCFLKKEKEAELDSSEKFRIDEFRKCTKDVDVEYCNVLHPETFG